MRELFNQNVLLIAVLLLLSAFSNSAYTEVLLSENVQREDVPSVSESLKASFRNEYELLPGDIISISVWGEEDMTREVLILPDHTISYPLIGLVDIHKLTVSALTDKIEKALSEFIPKPSVQIAIKQIRGNKVFIMGKVNRPGEYLLSSPTSILQALSMAGGLSTFANESGIKVIRGIEDKQEAISFNYDDVSEGKNLKQNITLQSGDVLLVP